MLTASLILISLAGLVGIIPMRSLLKGVPAKWRFILLHGGLAVTGIALLFVQATGKSEAPLFALMMLIMAALGGVALFFLHRFKAPIPAGMAMIHPMVGVFGLILLILFMLTGEG